jgi:hypothetical protein
MHALCEMDSGATYRDEIALLIEVVALVKVGRGKQAALPQRREIPRLLHHRVVVER